MSITLKIDFADGDMGAIRKFVGVYDNDTLALNKLASKITEVVRRNELSVQIPAGVLHAWVQDEEDYQQAGITFTPNGFGDILDMSVVESCGQDVKIKIYEDVYDECPTKETVIKQQDIKQALS